MLGRSTRPYKRPVMIISIKPAGLLNTDNVRRIDGLCSTRVSRRWRKGGEEGRKGDKGSKRADEGKTD